MSNKNENRVNWQKFKEIISLGNAFLEMPLNGSVKLLTFDGNGGFFTIIHTDGNMPDEYLDYQQNYQHLKKINITDLDNTGREVTRFAATDRGWAYLAHPIEFVTSKKDSVYSKDWKGNNRGVCSIRFYDANNSELTAQSEIDSSCIKTTLTINLGHDFDIVSGKLEQIDAPKDSDGNIVDLRLYTLIGIFDENGIAFDPDGPGDDFKEQVTEFVGGVNLKFYNSNKSLETDGRAGKKLFKIVNESIPYNQNQIQIITKHDVGFKHDLMILLEYFRKP